jgi:restriction endonuclease S subunit
MPGRGQAFPARRYGGELGPVLPAGQIYDIRVKDESIVSSKYLEWYLNRTNTQLAIKSSLTGTTIPALNKSVLQKLPIRVPALSAQDKIVELKTLFDERIRIRENLNRLELQQLDSICQKLLEDDLGDYE